MEYGLCAGGRYATYSNAILFSLFVQIFPVKLGSVYGGNISYPSYLRLELHKYYIISMYTSGVWAKEINFTFQFY